MSAYQKFKLTILSIIPVSKDAMHIYIGCACLLLAATIRRRPLSSFTLLLPGLALSLLMEVADLRDDLRFQGRFRWDHSIHDVVNTNLIPLAIVTFARTRRLRTS